ncbi:MAG TPA: ATP-binding protein, partial [Chloroflexota bacterium]|nr:ATP-binding protein [Chloroflexota bacterium]
ARTGRKAVDRASQGAAEWAYNHGTEVSLPSGASGRHLFIPLRAGDQTVGVMEVGPRQGERELDRSAYHLVTSFAAQAALLIARAHAADETRRLRILEESDRLKSALLSAVSHDLRTPLAAIKASATSLLLDETGWTGEERRELLLAIDDSADRLNRLVGNLLDLSRIEAGALTPVLDQYSVEELIETVRPRLEALAPEHEFGIEVQPGIQTVRVDLVRIEQLLVNLVENAARYAPAGTPIRIHIDADETGLSIRVVDHGPGVPLAARDRIFDAFYRVRPHSDRYPGTGLGLAICRGIAEAHGGTLAVGETPGGGATFVASLPVIPAPVHATS